MGKFLSLAVNERGCDWVVGDIHGQFELLEKALIQVGFNPKFDRLVACGDLVDRGPCSHHVLEWLAKDWFFSVRGNHEEMCMNMDVEDYNSVGMYVLNGGKWFCLLDEATRAEIQAKLKELPLAIEIQVDGSLHGVVHADVPFASWAALKDYLSSDIAEAFDLRGSKLHSLTWGTERYDRKDESVIEGIDLIWVGHKSVRDVLQLGNVGYIDTGAAYGGKLTMVNLTRFEIHEQVYSDD